MKRKNVNAKRNKKIAAFLPSEPTVRLLTVCLGCIILPLIALFLAFSDDIFRFPSYALAIYPPMFEYIMISIALTSAGGFVMEYSVREKSR